MSISQSKTDGHSDEAEPGEELHAIYRDLAGKRVVITGASAGIGRAIAEAFAKQGASLVMIDRSGAAAAKSIPGAEHIKCDVSNSKDVASAIARVLDGPPVHALINNAGSDAGVPFADVTAENWDASLAVNLRHQFLFSQGLADSMANAGGGSIIHLGSVSWMMGATGRFPYTASKAYSCQRRCAWFDRHRSKAPGNR